MTLNLEIEWRDYQRDFIRWIISPDAKGTVTSVKAPRQVGKTTVLTALLMYYACNYKNGFSILIEPTNKQCMRVFNEMRNLLEPVIKTSNQAQMNIEFITGSKIQFLSGEADVASFQGYVVKNGVLCVDEGAFISDEVFYALTPTTDVHKCPIIITSTPRFRQGFFYDYFVEGMNGLSKTIFSFDWAGKSILSEEKLEFYRRTLPERLFKNYYLGQFSDAVGSVFGSFNHILSNEFEYPTYHRWETNIDCYIGIDWGTGQGKDYTAVSVFNSLKQQIYIERWNDLDETQQIERIVDIIKRFKPITVQYEKNGIGAILGGLLQKAVYQHNLTCGIKSFNTSNTSKSRLVNSMCVAIQNDGVQLLDDENLISEMTTYELKVSQNGTVTYNGANGTHDDLVMATLISFDLVNKNNEGMYNLI